MIISLLVAMDERSGIGLHNRLPWHLSADLKRFKELTMGHHILMGRRTYESIGRSLPGRKMVVLTHDKDFQPEAAFSTAYVQAAASLPEALALAAGAGEDEALVIGGSQVFAQALPLAERIYLTRVHACLEADAYFPALDEHLWRQTCLSSHPADDKNQFPYTFYILNRIEEP
jgi:dihydrofolate reductase